nr:SDR family oxidoreductase [Bradyrhizobium sp. 199]
MTGRHDAPVVVVTGASSGIGRATALAFAARKARVVLVGREAAALEVVVRCCQAHGAEAVACAADLTDHAAVERIRDTAAAAYGRIDVWVNCAAVLLLGRFEDIPLDAFRRVVETNFLGCVNGSRVALSQFRTQGDCGVLINTSSMLGMMGEPFASPYVASKFAIRGFTACLRQEFEQVPGIHISAVMPWAVDTPIFSKLGNVFGRRARSIFPVIASERVAQTIVSLSERPRREVIVGASGYMLSVALKFAPMLVERVVARAAPAVQFEPGCESPTTGNLFAPTGPYSVAGGWKKYWADRALRLFRPNFREIIKKFRRHLT